MSDLFHVVDGAQVILLTKGVFYQKKVYRRGNRQFAGYGAGFVRLGGHKTTSAPNVSWENIDLSDSGIVVATGSTGEPVISFIASQEVQPLKKAA